MFVATLSTIMTLLRAPAGSSDDASVAGDGGALIPLILRLAVYRPAMGARLAAVECMEALLAVLALVSSR